jgi:deazaflavin-dependent oxidoreductase (nitroreductase family)
MMADDSIKPPRWLKPMNKVFMFMLRLGLPISGKEGPLVLTVPGRKSGQPRSTPITPMYVDSTRYVIAGFPGADWEQNARAADTAMLTAGRNSETVRMVELSADEARPLLRQFPTLVPTGVSFMKRSGLVTDGTPEEFEALADRCAVFRFEPA